jgi:hypothetical protein
MTNLLSKVALAYIAGREDERAAKGWKPGDLRCEGCDNGLEKTWAYCPWCSRPTWTEAYVEAEAAFDAKRLASEACPAEGER